MIQCECGGDSQVLASRVVENKMRRRRLCLACGTRWSTVETRVTALTKTGPDGGGTVPTGVHPVIEFVYREKTRRRLSNESIQKDALVSRISKWRRQDPRIGNVEAVLNVLGYTLTHKRKND